MELIATQTPPSPVRPRLIILTNTKTMPSAQTLQQFNASGQPQLTVEKNTVAWDALFDPFLRLVHSWIKKISEHEEHSEELSNRVSEWKLETSTRYVPNSSIDFDQCPPSASDESEAKNRGEAVKNDFFLNIIVGMLNFQKFQHPVLDPSQFSDDEDVYL